jgi:inosose dehydratase
VELPTFDRRRFLGCTALASGGLLVATSPASVRAASAPPLHLACNQYSWFVFYERENKKLADRWDTALGEMASVGIDGLEPGVESPAELQALGPLARKHGIALRSVYVNSTLHDAGKVEESIARVLAIARVARPLGTTILVTNPSPIRWGGPEDKTDAQLVVQAGALDRLGRELDGLGMRLAYHNHDVELRQAARELHHMLAGTDPRYVHLCLDAHWVYRGSGNSQVALFDVVRLYGGRIVELHVRQSRGGVWSETLEEGDVDYPRLVRALVDLKLAPHVVLEQAVETGTPHTMDVVEAHRRTVAYARRVLSPLAGA